MTHTAVDRFGARTLLLLSLGLLAACGGRHRLAQYDFPGRTVAVVPDLPHAPDIRTGPFTVDLDDPVRAVLETGAQIAREVEARRMRARLDSASRQVDVADRLAQQTLERASRYLGADPVQDEDRADYVFDFYVREYGLDARRWDAAAYAFVEAEAVLIDAATGVEIWRERVRTRDALTPRVWGFGSAARDVITAGMLSTLSVDDLARMLERLGDYAADHITEELRSDLRKVRDDRRR